jgi:hypothetical protein
MRRARIFFPLFRAKREGTVELMAVPSIDLAYRRWSDLGIAEAWAWPCAG